MTVAPAFPGGAVRVQQRLYAGGVDVVVRLDTSRRQESAVGNLVVTPGARAGYVTIPERATFRTR